MRTRLTESALRNIISQAISEAMEYDKDAKRYRPKYSGNRHSDAGKFIGNNSDDYNYGRNDYKWKNEKGQRKFNRWQDDNDFSQNADMTDDEERAQAYSDGHDQYYIEKKSQPMIHDLCKSHIDDIMREIADKVPYYRHNDFELKYAIQNALKDVFDEL